MPANTPQIKKSSGNRRRYAVSVDFLAAFYPVKFQAQAYRSPNFFQVYISCLFLVDYLMYANWISLVCDILSNRKLKY